jgi:LacI family transcriptional regulator
MAVINEAGKTGRRPNKSSRPTIFSVAKEAGVSISTVSRVLNHADLQEYSAEVKSKVVAASKKLNYRPNAMARSLARQTNPGIGVLCPSLTDINITRALDRIVEIAETHQRHVVVTTHPEKVPWANLLDDGTVGWVIAINHFMVEQSDDLILPETLERVIAVTTLPQEYVKRTFALSVTWDTARQGELIAEHLAEMGHKEVAMLAGLRTKPDEVPARLRALDERACELGITIHSVYNPNETKEDISLSGRVMMQEVLAKYPRVTAVICRQDYHAIGVYAELYQTGKRIPEDMAVIGAYNLQRILQFCPALTSADAPLVEGVEFAMNFLLGKEDAGTRHVDLTDHIRLWQRESTVGIQ